MAHMVLFLELGSNLAVQPRHELVDYDLLVLIGVDSSSLENLESVGLDISEEILGEDAADQVLVGVDHLLAVLVLLGFLGLLR